MLSNFTALALVRIRKKSLLLLLILSLALLSGLAATKIATSYFSQDSVQLNLALVVLDDSDTMGQLTQLALNTPELRQNYNFIPLDSQAEGVALVEQNQAYACIVLPEDFLYSLQTGQNYPPLVILNSTQTADAKVAQALCDVLTEMMRQTQSGIYVATDWVRAADAVDSNFYFDSNFAYLTYVLDRSDTFLTTNLPYVEVLDLASHYALTLAIFFLFLSTALFYDVLNIRKDFLAMKALATRSLHHHTLYFTQLAVVFLLYFALFTGLLVGLGGVLSPLVMLSLANATALFLLVQALLFQLIPHYLPAMLLSLTLHSLALVAAGGILPTLFLPQQLVEAANLFPLTHIRTLLSAGLVSVDRLPLLNLIVLVANWLLCALLWNYNDKLCLERGVYDGVG